MTGLVGRVHSMAREVGSAAVCEEEAALNRRMQGRKRVASGAGWAKRPNGPEAKKTISE
jgi:hypothetical protein